MIIPVTETVIGVQVIGHNSDTIIKSPIVKARISNSLQDSNTVASDSPVDVETRVEQLEAVKHTHANKAILDGITAEKTAEWDGKSDFSGSYNDLTDTPTALKNPYALTVNIDGVNTNYDGSAEKVVAVKGATKQVATGSNIALADNTEYRLTDVTELSVTYPDGNFECWMSLTFAASGNVTVTLPTGTKYIGAAPSFKNGEIWEVSIKDSVVVAQKVGDGSMAPVETVEDGTEVKY